MWPTFRAKRLPDPQQQQHGDTFSSAYPFFSIFQILKDIIIRSNLLQGKRVHFIPGWDCHGLPIELKAMDLEKVKDPVQIRKRARDFARKTINKQKAAFRSWGIMGDWDKGTYETFSTEYVIRELQLFWQLYDQVSKIRGFMISVRMKENL